MDSITSDSRVTGQLSRLIGLAALSFEDRLSEVALQAAGALCDFDADCELRSKCLTSAAIVAAGGSQVEEKVDLAHGYAIDRRAAGRGIFECTLAMSLTLLEGASVQGGPPAEGQSEVYYVTGQHSWLHKDRWVLRTVHIAALCGVGGFNGSSTGSPGLLRQKVVLATSTGCAPLTLPSNNIVPHARVPCGRLNSACCSI